MHKSLRLASKRKNPKFDSDIFQNYRFDARDQKDAPKIETLTDYYNAIPKERFDN